MLTINYEQLRELQIHHEAAIVNVLPTSLFEKTHIPGAINIPHQHEDFTDEVEDMIGGKDYPVAIYGSGHACEASKKAALQLDMAGFTNVMHYEGGATEWHENMLRLVG